MRLYRLLLHLYPSAYRAEYGEEIAAVFSEELSRGTRFTSQSQLWLSAVAEILYNSAALHLEIAKRDFQYAIRSLRRAPGFTITAILLIAIGVGANAAIFTLADFVLVRPLPFPHPDRLVKVWEKLPGYSLMELSPANYRDINAASNSFDSLAVYFDKSMNLVGQGEPQRIEVTKVTANLFPTLQKQPWIGHYFAADDDKPGAPGTAVLSYALWQTQFGGEGAVLGRSILLDDASYTVIGVMPPDFLFPTRETQLWTAARFDEDSYQDRNDNFIVGVGRLKPGVSLERARSEMALISARIEKQFPKENKDVGVSVIAMRDELSPLSRLLLTALCGASLCVLIIACANLANLLLARSLARKKELSIRVSLGAHPRQLLRQLLSESLLLAFAGAAGAIALASAILPLLSRLVPNDLPIDQVPPVDLRLLLFALGLTILTVIAFALAPALGACTGAGFGGLREGVRTGGAGNHRARSLLVIAEVIVSVVLLISSGLLVRALWRIQQTDPGFSTKNILTLRTALPFPKYDKTADREKFYSEVLTGIHRLPGVTTAAYTSGLPMVWGGGIWPVAVNGDVETRTAGHVASMRFITPEFFATLSIPLQSGRGIEESDTADRPYVAVVSESFVERYWPGQSPIGKHFDFGFHDREVVGIVRDIHVRGLDRISEPQVYLSYRQVPDGWLVPYAPKDLVVHSSQPPAQLIRAIREIIRAADPQQPISNVRTLETIVAGDTEPRTVQMRVLVAFTAVAIFLAGLGIYGLLSFAVTMRRQEFGIRMALGAQHRDIFGIVVRHGAILAIAGLVPGVALAYVAARLMDSLLAGIKPADALTFSSAAFLCLATAILGSVVPALRAVRVDPASVMRTE
jgi:putative ABC transport system permease protein